MELDSLKMEDGARELMSTPEMQPYLRYCEAAMVGGDAEEALREIAVLPLEARYVWRIALALKQGFADFDDWNVINDRNTLPQQDRARLMALLRHRPIQFCLFLKALLGAEAMERIMMEAIGIAKTC